MPSVTFLLIFVQIAHNPQRSSSQLEQWPFNWEIDFLPLNVKQPSES